MAKRAAKPDKNDKAKPKKDKAKKAKSELKSDVSAKLSKAAATVKSTRGKVKSAGTAAPAAASAANPRVVVTLTHDQIAARAYEIWLRKGRPTGQDEQNWRQAEAELLAAAE